MATEYRTSPSLSRDQIIRNPPPGMATTQAHGDWWVLVGGDGNQIHICPEGGEFQFVRFGGNKVEDLLQQAADHYRVEITDYLGLECFTPAWRLPTGRL